MTYTAIYNATRNELSVANADAMRGILAHAAARGADMCYTLAGFEYIDTVMLASYTAEDFVRDGWQLMA
jgi:hypothetical protein